jgi:hypothetical protein
VASGVLAQEAAGFGRVLTAGSNEQVGRKLPRRGVWLVEPIPEDDGEEVPRLGVIGRELDHVLQRRACTRGVAERETDGGDQVKERGVVRMTEQVRLRVAKCGAKPGRREAHADEPGHHSRFGVPAAERRSEVLLGAGKVFAASALDAARIEGRGGLGFERP